MKRRVGRPAAVAFDVIETLFSLESMRPRLVEAGLPATALEWWFARTLRDGFALAATGAFQPFVRVAELALAEVARSAGAGTGPGRVREILAGLSSLEAHPDAEPALTRLADAGVPVLALTNGAPATTRTLLVNAGLDRLVGQVVSIEDAGHWKPRPEVYRHAADRAGVPPGALALVAVHAWDVHGAVRAGLVAGWAGWLEGTFPTVFDRPHVQAQTLVQVAEGLLALPGL